MGPLQAGAREGFGPGEAGAREGTRPPRAGARGKGRGRLVHGPGRLWPWPRRPGMRGVEDPSRVRHGSVTDDGPRHRDAEKATLPGVFFRRCDHVTMVLGPYRGPKVDNAFSSPVPRPRGAGKCDVLGVFVNDRASPASLSGKTITEVRLRDVPAPSSPRTPHVPGVSWRPQPARAATRRPGRISDGRPLSASRPGRSAPPAALRAGIAARPIPASGCSCRDRRPAKPPTGCTRSRAADP